MSRRSWTAVAGLLFAVLIWGCREKGPEFVPVHGVVRLNGAPERGLVVRFVPDPQKGSGLSAFATGKTDEQGNYTARYEFHGKEGAGAPVGWAKVTVFDSKLGLTPQGQESKPSPIPYAYSSVSTTPLSVEVKSGDNTIDLDVKK